MLVHSPFILIVKLLLGCHHIIEEHEADKFSARETTKDLVFEYIDDQLSILNMKFHRFIYLRLGKNLLSHIFRLT